MLSFLIARDTMHQQQWLAVVEELGGYQVALPTPNSFDQAQEKPEYSYVFLGTNRDGEPPPVGRFDQGASLDGRSTFTARQNVRLGDEPVLGPARPESGVQREQIGSTAPGRV
jgi:Mn-containing catalase